MFTPSLLTTSNCAMMFSLLRSRKVPLPCPRSGRIREGGFRGLGNLGIGPGLAIGTLQPFVSLRVADDALLLPVPLHAASQFPGEHGEQAHVRGAMADLDVADRMPAGLDGIEEIRPEFLDVLLVRLVQF